MSPSVCFLIVKFRSLNGHSTSAPLQKHSNQRPPWHKWLKQPHVQKPTYTPAHAHAHSLNTEWMWVAIILDNPWKKNKSLAFCRHLGSRGGTAGIRADRDWFLLHQSNISPDWCLLQQWSRDNSGGYRIWEAKTQGERKGKSLMSRVKYLPSERRWEKKY